MNRRVIIILVAIAFLFFVTSLVIFLTSRREVTYTPVETDTRETDTRDLERVKLKVFFFTEGSPVMQPVPLELVVPEFKDQLYVNFVRYLLQPNEDYVSPVPENVQLRTCFFIPDDHMLVLDFSDRLVSGFPAGTTSETEFIYFMVDNICFNFQEVKKVKFLIMGNEYQTLSGHLDLMNPFYPDYRYIRVD